jgi:hypothetical protein
MQKPRPVGTRFLRFGGRGRPLEPPARRGPTVTENPNACGVWVFRLLFSRFYIFADQYLNNDDLLQLVTRLPSYNY